ncbi:MAG TPA: iron ABC transporter permease, partial [Dehalococcoidia bacterium]|nr:iron ABC transporter permease [Dehalococcoidia bacterium]
MPAGFTWPQAAVAALIAAFLLLFLIVPLVTVVYIAFADGTGGVTLQHFASFFQLSLMRESFWNSLIVATLSVVFATFIAV